MEDTQKSISLLFLQSAQIGINKELNICRDPVNLTWYQSSRLQIIEDMTSRIQIRTSVADTIRLGADRIPYMCRSENIGANFWDWSFQTWAATSYLSGSGRIQFIATGRAK
jgi:hypothetical protein